MQTTPPVQASDISTSQKLAILQSVLDGTDQALPENSSSSSFDPHSAFDSLDPVSRPGEGRNTPDEFNDPLNPPKARPGGKEQENSTFSAELSGLAQHVEVETSPEIPPEVESYLQHVEDHAQTAPHEIVVADDQSIQSKPLQTNQKLILLPLTEKEHDEGAKMKPIWSIRWLVTWSEKLMKMFRGQVVYKDSAPENQEK